MDKLFSTLALISQAFQSYLVGDSGIGTKLAAALLSAPWGVVFIAVVFAYFAARAIFEYMYDGDIVTLLAQLVRQLVIGGLVLGALAMFPDIQKSVLQGTDSLAKIVLEKEATEAVAEAGGKIYGAMHSDFGGQPGGGGTSWLIDAIDTAMRTVARGDSLVGLLLVNAISYLINLIAFGFAVFALVYAYMLIVLGKVQLWLSIAFMPVGILAFVLDRGMMLGAAAKMALTGMGIYVIASLLTLAGADAYATGMQALAQSIKQDGVDGGEVLVALAGIAVAWVFGQIIKNAVSWSQGIFGSVGVGFDHIRMPRIPLPRWPRKGGDSK